MPPHLFCQRPHHLLNPTLRIERAHVSAIRNRHEPRPALLRKPLPDLYRYDTIFRAVYDGHADAAVVSQTHHGLVQGVGGGARRRLNDAFGHTMQR